MIIPDGGESRNSSEDDDVLVVENHPKSLQNKRHTARSDVSEQSKQVYILPSSSQSNHDEGIKGEEVDGKTNNEDDEKCTASNENEEALKEQGCEQDQELQEAEQPECSTHFDFQKRHLDDDTSFFFRGHNISEGIKRAAAMCDNVEMLQRSKTKRKHHNLGSDELGKGKAGIQSKAQPSAEHISEGSVEKGGLGDLLDEPAAPIKYDAVYDPEYAKLYAKYTTRSDAPLSSLPRQDCVGPVLGFKSVHSRSSTGLNINVQYYVGGRATTLLLNCERSASFGDVNEALNHRFCKDFTLMYRKTPILSSLATPEALGMEEGSVIDAFDDVAFGAFRSLQEKEESRKRELMEAERLASTSIQSEGYETVYEDDQEGGIEQQQGDSHLWTLNIRISAKHIESVQINPDDAVSRLLCLVLEKMGRPGASAALVWDGMTLPADAIVRDADVEDGDQLELHFKQT